MKSKYALTGILAVLAIVLILTPIASVAAIVGPQLRISSKGKIWTVDFSLTGYSGNDVSTIQAYVYKQAVDANGDPIFDEITGLPVLDSVDPGPHPLQYKMAQLKEDSIKLVFKQANLPDYPVAYTGVEGVLTDGELFIGAGPGFGMRRGK